MKITSRYDAAITLYESEVAATMVELVNSAVRDKANLIGADLPWADLTRANLTRADLIGANLTRANLIGAKINWQSHTLIAELLKRSAPTDIEKRKIAGLILISTEWCWSKWLELRRDPLFDWAVDTLAGYVQEGDNAPEILVNAKARIDASKAE